MDDPNDLLCDMSDFIQEVGYTSSFIEQSVGTYRTNLWRDVAKGITNDLSFQN